jgi:hypothetical protein
MRIGIPAFTALTALSEGTIPKSYPSLFCLPKRYISQTYYEYKHGLLFYTAVSPCYHGMARPQVKDGEMAFNMEGSCEYTKYAVVDSRQWVIFQLGC